MREESWLETYLHHTERLEAPTQFHRWTAIAISGLAMGRKIWISKEGMYGVFPGQMMVTLVADSAMLRKSTAIRVGTKLLDALRERVPHSVNRLVDRTSPQAMLYDLVPRDEGGEPLPDADACACIIADELGAFFSSESFMETLATHVTALNDAPTGLWNHDTLSFAPSHYRMRFMGSGETILRNPCIGLLGGTTPIGLAKELPAHAQTGGFLGRTIPVYAAFTDREPNAMLSPDPKVVTLNTDLLEGLVRMTKLRGLVRLTEAAEKFYIDWYRRYNREQQRTTMLQVATGYYGRKHDHLLRVAMNLAGMDYYVKRNARGKYRLWVADDHLEQALKYLDLAERDFPYAFAMLDRGNPAGTEKRLLSILQHRYLKYRGTEKRKQWLDRQTLVRRLYPFANTAQVDTALRQLAEIGNVERRGNGKQADYRWIPKTSVRLAQENQKPREPEDDDDGEDEE